MATVTHASAKPAMPIRHLANFTFGVTGAGVKVGVISDSAQSLAALQASGDLPAGVTILPGQAGSGTSEGTAMMEIVNDIAPGASLFFATANGGQAQFAQNILDLHAAGCNIIVDDVGYFAEPVFQDGIIAQAVETVAAAGTSYFSAAGNSGNLDDGTAGVWEGDFVPIAGWHCTPVLSLRADDQFGRPLPVPVFPGPLGLDGRLERTFVGTVSTPCDRNGARGGQ
jgi:hypothetical protein